MIGRLQTGKPFEFRLEDYAGVKGEDLFVAAKWWARNATMMSSHDPWKSHFTLVPIVALIAPDIHEFVVWLDTARRATGATPGSIYESCLVELGMATPPWRDPQFRDEHDAHWSKGMCRQQMHELLREIRADSAIATPGKFVDDRFKG